MVENNVKWETKFVKKISVQRMKNSDDFWTIFLSSNKYERHWKNYLMMTMKKFSNVFVRSQNNWLSLNVLEPASKLVPIDKIKMKFWIELRELFKYFYLIPSNNISVLSKVFVTKFLLYQMVLWSWNLEVWKLFWYFGFLSNVLHP